ncbi:hypothetical protein Rhe02_41520 [Rhizocola hellebori]|uniref:DUF4232 domain-containing protein n=1 Tax=Rhizocola hellebori TaxID=1392758 RepID=A0A8J3VH31_9ACTN|nr:hypothetical protein [Rhizocola hellebori]GIH06085.1 hypothetical protein Rhe02_41520 [Rhizocola hellebori]
MTVEQQLRETLQGKTQAVTGWADPVTQIERGVRRRKRRRLAVQAVAAVTVLVTVLTVGLIQRRPAETPTNIDATVDEAVGVPHILRRSPRPDRAACPPERIMEVEWIVQSAPWGMSTGFGARLFTDQRCTLSGRPQLFGVDVATGQRVEIPFVPNVAPMDSGRVRQFPATIDGGELARVEIHGNSACPTGQSPQSYRDLSLLIGDRQLDLPDQRSLTAVCGADVSEWFVEPPMEYASLDAYLLAPKTLRRGEDFSYTVQIANRFPRKFNIQDCPVYLLGLGAQGQTWRRLSCDISSIDAHRTVRFRMTGHVPADAAVGPAKLTWIGVLPNGEVIVADMATSGYPVSITQ